MSSPAERLLAAADLLDKRAGEAAEGPWAVERSEDFPTGQVSWSLPGIERWRGLANDVQVGEDEATARYIATMHPEVGKALAAWLRALGNEDITPEPEGPDTWYLHDRCDRYINDDIERLRCKCYPAPLKLADLILAGAS